MDITIYDTKIPAKYEVCPNCDGEGSMYLGGRGFVLTAEDFYEDPDLHEDLRSGTYNQPCVHCKGKRVVKVPDEANMNDEQKRIVREFNDNFYERQSEARAECFDMEGRNMISAERISYD